jgi:hypothetical protein
MSEMEMEIGKIKDELVVAAGRMYLRSETGVWLDLPYSPPLSGEKSIGLEKKYQELKKSAEIN